MTIVSNKVLIHKFKESLSLIRHDMRTPVGHIMGYAEMIEEDLDGSLSPEFSRDLNVFHFGKNSNSRKPSVVKTFLQFSK